MWSEQSENPAAEHYLEPGRIDPNRDMAARTKKRDEPLERPSGVRCVMEHTEAVNEIEGPLPERQRHDVCSVDVHVGSLTKISSSGEDRLAQVDGVNLRPGVGGDLREAAHATT